MITDLGVLRPASDGELELVAVHPGVEPDQVQEATGWELRIADELEHTEPVEPARARRAARAAGRGGRGPA